MGLACLPAISEQEPIAEGALVTTQGKRFNPISRSGELAISFEPPNLFDVRETVARQIPYESADRFLTGLDLTYRLFTARAIHEYTDELPVVLQYLCIKTLNDLLAAVLIVKSGYHFQAWPLLRGALEAAELMDYFSLKPDDILKWVNKEKRFDSTSWVKEHLPQTKLRQQFFDLLNENSHANLRNIDALSTYSSGPDRKTLAVGPIPFPLNDANPLILAAQLISYPTRVLWLSQRDVVSTEWITEFHAFDEANGFLLGDSWEAC